MPFDEPTGEAVGETEKEAIGEVVGVEVGRPVGEVIGEWNQRSGCDEDSGVLKDGGRPSGILAPSRCKEDSGFVEMLKCAREVGAMAGCCRGSDHYT